MTAYTTLSAVKRQLGIALNNQDDDDLLNTYVTEASQAIDTWTGRVFSGTTGTTFYDARYPVVEARTLYFDQDYLAVDALSNGANGTINSSLYRLLPLNYSPKYALQLLDKSNMAWLVGNDGYAQNAICVIGTTGYCQAASRPADVTLAATKLASWLYQVRDNDGTAIQMADGSQAIPAQAPPFVFKVLEKYIRRVAYSEAAHS